MSRSVGCILMAFALTATACLSGGESNTKTLLADYSNDRFASAYLGFFPNRIQVHPGDELVVKQTWTGEPHTFTGGKLVEPVGKVVSPFLAAYLKGGFEALPKDEPPELTGAISKIPGIFSETFGKVNQNGAQPCYLDEGEPPSNPDTPCPSRPQPAFNGRQSFYNSGYIHYAGPSGNIFRVPIAKDATPGHYFFFCTVHGPLMSVDVEIKPSTVKIPSEAQVARTASKELEVFGGPLEKAWKAAKAGKIAPPPELKELAAPGSRYFKGRLAGLGTLPGDKQYEAFISEFVPSKTTAKAGEPVTWTIFGEHTISFDVPKYLPIFTVARDGTVSRNPKVDLPAGGAPPLPQHDDQRSPGAVKIDGGTWSGSGFWSSGLVGSEPYLQYTLKITKPGTYRYACLVHPAMVGTIVVSP